ncbi:hypothetical protein [Oligoflexus tunisiensis]|uniref:hypothetical protein n=1 Tax=Oligoflexus tunisiensis TaxID=708132 RepID=UPI00114CEBA3|nr:hypothetical protein [Oligoflexus tunisiensis]
MRQSCLWIITLLMLGCAPQPSAESTLDFNSGEHVILGDLGYRTACDTAGSCAPRIVRADGQMSFTYGELVAFSGDFYATPEDIYLEKVEPLWKWHRNDPHDVKKLFQKEVETIENFLHGHSDEAYPDFSLAFAWNYPDYLSLVLANESHFGFYNMLAYVKYHSRALALALQAHDHAATNPVRARTLFTQALFVNGFADHFLTDGFAAGHVRAPRAQILKWAGFVQLNERAAGTLAKVIHDSDGEVRESGEHGLNVRNARGDRWLTRCDAQLFWENSLVDPAIQLPAQAVAASVREILDAYEHGTTIAGVFAATELVPFPAAGERPLIEILPADMPDAAYDAIIRQMPFYMQIKVFSGVDKNVLKQLTAALPGIMQDFRRDVEVAIDQHPELSQRLPQAYQDAYRLIE